jgi:hypothetical protein
MIPKAKLDLFNPISYSDHVAKAKMQNSIIKRITPGVTMGAEPERLGSLGTANVPHIITRIIGIPIARTYRSHESLYFQPQIPTDTSANISRRNRTVKLIGCDPIILFRFVSRLTLGLNLNPRIIYS